MTYRDFLEEYLTNILPNKPTYIREGQALMNYLGDVWLEEYKRISSVHYYDETDIDCFFNSLLMDNTLKHLEKVWYNYPN